MAKKKRAKLRTMKEVEALNRTRGETAARKRFATVTPEEFHRLAATLRKYAGIISGHADEVQRAGLSSFTMDGAKKAETVVTTLERLHIQLLKATAAAIRETRRQDEAT